MDLDTAGPAGRMVYVTSAFPAYSLVFQYNEMLGLLDNGVSLSVYSCRPRLSGEDAASHHFARRLEARTEYPGVRNLVRGLFWLAGRPRSFRAASSAWRQYCASSQASPTRRFKLALSTLSGLGAYTKGDSAGPTWIHADFGKDAAGVGCAVAAGMGVGFSFKVHAYDIYHVDDPGRVPRIRFLASRASIVFAEHDHGRITLEEILDGAASPPLKVVYTGARTDEAPAPPPVSPTRSGQFVIMGRLVPKKGFDVLVRALAKTKSDQIRIGIWGSGPEEARLRQIAAELGVESRLTFHGPYLQQDLGRIFSEAVALVVPSVRCSNGDMDGVPTVVYEAMAWGRGVIASSLGGIPETVRDGVSGWLFPPGDEDALAELLTEVSSDPEGAAEMGRSARRLAETEFDCRTTAGELAAGVNRVGSTVKNAP